MFNVTILYIYIILYSKNSTTNTFMKINIFILAQLLVFVAQASKVLKSVQALPKGAQAHFKSTQVVEK